MIKAAIGIGAALLFLGTAARATDIAGVGASGPEPLYRKWTALYAAQGGDTVRYMAIGSRGGLKQIKAGTVDFGTSDVPLTPVELDRAGLVQFPVVISGVVPVVNLLGLMPGELKLNGPVMADIYLGRITHWDDPRLIALNPHVALPHAPIQLGHRADGAATTLAFTTYLAGKSADWKAKIGSGLEVAWPKGAAGKGDDGVAALVRNTPGAIGYLDDAFARADEADDSEFYALPRLVTHIDAAAIAALTEVYRDVLPAGGVLLDLMSSWVSHLPQDVDYADLWREERRRYEEARAAA